MTFPALVLPVMTFPALVLPVMHISPELLMLALPCLLLLPCFLSSHSSQDVPSCTSPAA